MLGSHLSISGGLHNALLEAETLNLQTVQIFTKNQQQWKCKPLETLSVDMFRQHTRRLGLSQLVAHDSYLINLGSADPELWQKSVDAFAVEMQRCDALGIDFLVTHPGAHGGAGEEAGIARVVQGLDAALAREDQAMPGRVTVCLETTAGQGTSLGWQFEHLAEIRRRVHHPERFAVCLDTCHVFAAGYDITTAAKTRRMLDLFDKKIGIQHLRVIHANDSKKPLGSRVDRHAHLGHGGIGRHAFRVLCTDDRVRNIPKILETPKDKAPDGRPWDVVNLELLRGFAKKRRTKKT